MPRPRLMQEESHVYSASLPLSVYSLLQAEAHNLSKQSGKQISVAHLIREALEMYLNETNLGR